MKVINFEKAVIEFNDIMFDYCWEHCTIGTRFSEGTEGWNLRDMVSEAQYHYDCCYEEGHGDSEGRYPMYLEITAEHLLSKSRYDRVVRRNNEEKEMHEYWLRKTRRLRGFIRKYSKYIHDLECSEGHCSCYD